MMSTQWERSKNTALHAQGRVKYSFPVSPPGSGTFSYESPFAEEPMAAPFWRHVWFYITEEFLLLASTCVCT